MFCTKCGNIVENGSKFCTKCGAVLEESLYNNSTSENGESNSSSIFSADFNVTNLNGEVGNEEKEEPVMNYGGIQQESTYSLADMPESGMVKEPKKRSCLVSVLCGILTLLCGIVMFASILTLLFVSVFNKPTSKVLSVGSNTGNLGDIPVSVILDEDDEDYDEDKTFAEFVYDNLDEKTQDIVEVKDIEKILNDPAINEFFGDVISDYSQVAIGAKDEASITVESVMKLVEETEDIIEDALGREMKQSDYDKIEKELKKLDIEEKTKLEKSDDLDSDEENVVEAVAYFFSNTGKIMLSLLGVVLVMAVLILLLNLHKPYRPLFHLGYNTVVSAVLGLGVGMAYEMVIDEMDKESMMIMNMLSGFLGNPQKNITANSIAFLIVGIVIIILWVIAKAIASRRNANNGY